MEINRSYPSKDLEYSGRRLLGCKFFLLAGTAYLRHASSKDRGRSHLINHVCKVNIQQALASPRRYDKFFRGYCVETSSSAFSSKHEKIALSIIALVMDQCKLVIVLDQEQGFLVGLNRLRTTNCFLQNFRNRLLIPVILQCGD